jgi:hypothetical protein
MSVGVRGSAAARANSAVANFVTRAPAQFGLAAVALCAAIFCAGAFVAAAQTSPRYVVDGMALGSRVTLNSTAYREFDCAPSEQFTGFTWCTKQRDDKEPRGPFRTSISILHDTDGAAFYVNRYQEPAYWSTTEVDDDIEHYSKTHGQRPHIIRMPHRAGFPDGVLATWGDVELEPLDRDSLQILGEGRSPKRGFLIDYLGDLGRSAREGLPVYRIARGVGFVWAASYDQKGRGTLRFTAVNATALAPRLNPGPPPSPIAGPKIDELNQKIAELNTKLDDRDRQISELNGRLGRLQDQLGQQPVELRRQLDTLRTERDGLQKQRDAARRDLDTARSELDAALKEQASLQRRNGDLQKKVAELEDQLKPFLAKPSGRVALVIGNDRYPNLPPEKQLTRAVNDADAVGNALEDIGFAVTRGKNLDQKALLIMLAEFARRIKPDDIAVVFFAGHGVAIGGSNFILPSDILPIGIGPNEEDRLRITSIPEAQIVEELQKKARVLVLILDACRDNPFREASGRGWTGGERGLARPVREPEGVFAIYSAGFGETALDSLGPDDPNCNSVFTRVLVGLLYRSRTTHLADLMIDLREEVLKEAATVGHRQFPASYDQTRGGRIFLASRDPPDTQAGGDRSCASKPTPSRGPGREANVPN